MVTFKSYQEFFESIEVTKNFLVTFFFTKKKLPSFFGNLVTFWKLRNLVTFSVLRIRSNTEK